MINERIDKLIQEICGGNKRLFSRKINVSATVIENIVGKRQGKPSYEVIEKIIFAIENINADWLITGQGDMLKSTAQQHNGKADMSTSFIGTFTKPIVADINNVMGTGNTIGSSIPIGDHTSPVKRKKTDNPVITNAAVVPERLEVEKLKAEIERLNTRLELKETIIENKNLIIEEKERMINFLMEKK